MRAISAPSSATSNVIPTAFRCRRRRRAEILWNAAALSVRLVQAVCKDHPQQRGDIHLDHPQQRGDVHDELDF